MRLELCLLAALATASALATPSIASAGPPSPPPPPPPSSGATTPSADEPGSGGTAPGARQNPGERPASGTAMPTPKTPAPPSSPPPPGSANPTAPTPEPSAPPAKPVDLSSTWGYSKSRPLTPRYTRSAEDPSFAPANPSGFYSGVSTQGNHVPPLAPSDFSSKPALMTWTGFERAAEGSRVYFQLNGPVQHELVQNGLVLKVRMRNTKVNVKNNARRLDTRYFETPVREVTVRRVGKDTEATIELKREASPTIQLVDGKAGYKLLTVQFDDARPGAVAGGSDDPYRSAGGGGYVGGDTVEPQPPADAATDAQVGAGQQGGAAQGRDADAASAGATMGPGGAAWPAGWYPLDLYGVAHD